MKTPTVFSRGHFDFQNALPFVEETFPPSRYTKNFLLVLYTAGAALGS
jgi:hypothetical protein